MAGLGTTSGTLKAKAKATIQGKTDLNKSPKVVSSRRVSDRETIEQFARPTTGGKPVGKKK